MTIEDIKDDIIFAMELCGNRKEVVECEDHTLYNFHGIGQIAMFEYTIKVTTKYTSLHTTYSRITEVMVFPERLVFELTNNMTYIFDTVVQDD